MGYHIHILRTASCKAVPIGEAEVREAVTRMAGRLDVMPDAPELWLYQPALGRESEIVIVENGELWAKNPSDTVLALMIELAGYLGARVRGEELETYRTVGETYIHPDDRELAQQYRPRPGGLREMVARIRVWVVILVISASVLLLRRYLHALDS